MRACIACVSTSIRTAIRTGWLFSLNYIDVELVAPTGVDDDVVPAALALSPSYPNPFNPETTIEFALPAEGPVRLSVFDSRGRTVRVLVDERVPAGTHAVTWDGRDDAGQALASGVYFHRLEAAGVKRVGKMVLAK